MNLFELFQKSTEKEMIRFFLRYRIDVPLSLMFIIVFIIDLNYFCIMAAVAVSASSASIFPK